MTLVSSPSRQRSALSSSGALPNDNFLGERRNQLEATTLQSAVRLLVEARRVLANDNHAANQWIAKAAAILQAESDLREITNSTGSPRHRLAPWQVARVVRFIDAHLSEKIAVATLADIARLSTGHFARAFRATVGKSPHAFVISRRIERAKEEILLAKKPLAEIALECGFGDQAHMTRLFRRIVGVSPGVWRRAHGAAVRECCERAPDELPLLKSMLAGTGGMGSPAIAAE